MKELKEEIQFIKENPLLTIFIVGTFTGILPTIIVAVLFKITGID